jgi:sRNA-binding regulator protein Hfq
MNETNAIILLTVYKRNGLPLDGDTIFSYQRIDSEAVWTRLSHEQLNFKHAIGSVLKTNRLNEINARLLLLEKLKT